MLNLLFFIAGSIFGVLSSFLVKKYLSKRLLRRGKLETKSFLNPTFISNEEAIVIALNGKECKSAEVKSIVLARVVGVPDEESRRYNYTVNYWV